MNMKTCKVIALFFTPLVPILTNCDASTKRAIEAAASKAKVSISNLTGKHDSRLINNEADYGININFNVSNTGDTGAITVMPWLSCSEGEWSKMQTMNLPAGDSMQLSYFFEQPTINATNIQYGVKYLPK
jgi:hypothetical protein